MASKLVKIHTLQKARHEGTINEREYVIKVNRLLKKKRKPKTRRKKNSGLATALKNASLS